jgi:hypothetical protein
MSFLNPISPIQVLGQSSVSRESFYGTTFSNNIVGGYMQVNSLSDLIYTIPSATYGLIEYSANTIPIQFLKGSGTSWSPDVLTLNSDNLSSGRRKIGMLVYVREQEQLYQYTNDNFLTLWNAATAATGTVVISDFGTTVNNSTAAGQNFINSWTASTIDGYNGVVRSNAIWKKYYGTTLALTGGSFNSITGVLTLTNITGGTQTLSGFGSGGGGGAGITGGTFNQSTLDLNLTSSAGTVTINGVTGLYITGGTYSASTSTILLYNSTGGTINITGITASGGGGVTTTGGTYSAGTATFTNSTGGTFSVTGFSKYFVTGSTPTGITLNNGDRWFDTNSGIEVVWITDTDGSQWIQPTQGGGSSTSGGISGSGTTNFIPVWSGTSGITNSIIRANSTNVAINTSIDSNTLLYLYYTGTTGVFAQSQGYGVYGVALDPTGYGVYGFNNNSTGGTTGAGVSGGAFDGTAIYGQANGDIGPNYGVKGFTDSLGGSPSLNIGGYFRAVNAVDNYSIQLEDGTEGVDKVLVSKTSDGKANWSDILTGLTNVRSTTISATTYENLPQSISGGGTTSYIPKWTGSTGIGDSIIYDTGTNIGIGLTNPGYKLEVRGGITASGLGNAGEFLSIDTSPGGATVGLNAQFGTGIAQLVTYSNSPIVIATNNTERIRITNDGNFGIGIPSPSQKLHVSGNTLISGGLTASTISATTYQNLPTDVRVTGATYSNNNFTFTNNTGGTFSVLFNNVTGLTVNGILTVTGNTVLNRLTATTITATTYLNLPQSVSGTGTADYVTKWNGVGLGLVDSQIYDNGSFVGIGITTPTYHEGLSIQSGSGLLVNEGYINSVNGSLSFATVYDYSTWATGGGEIAIGTRGPLQQSQGTGNIGIGDKALQNNILGINNIAIGGTGSLLSNSGGTDNIAIGFNSLNQNISGINNISLGTDSLFNNLGNRNVAIGVGAGYTNGNRDRNVYIGYGAGYSNDGSSNIFIGDAAGYGDTSSSNRLIIGDTIYGDLSSKLIGINQANPVTTLDVNGTTRISGGLTASTVSATTYFNLPTDVRVTGATYSNNTFTFTNNTGGTFNVLFNTVTGLTVNGVLTVTGNTSLQSLTANTLNVTGNTLLSGLTASTISATTLTIGGSSTFKGGITATTLSGTTSRMVESSSTGEITANSTIITAYITSGGTMANLLENTSNWDINGVYTGSTITGTFQGQKHYNPDYFFEAVDDNLFIRYIRG